MKFTLLGLGFEAEVEATPYRPAKTGGDPDDCHDAEGGEIDVQSLYCEGHNAMYLLGSDLEDEIMQAIESALEKECADSFCEYERDRMAA